MSTSSHQKPQHTPSSGEIPPPPTPHEQDQTAAMIDATDAELAFRTERITQEEARIRELEQTKAELLALQQAENEKKAQTEASLKDAWKRQQEEHQKEQERLAAEKAEQEKQAADKAAKIASLLGEVASITGVDPEDVLASLKPGSEDAVVSMAAKILGASGRIGARATDTSDAPVTPQAPKLMVELDDEPTKPEPSLKPDLVINPDGTSKVVVSLDNQPPAAPSNRHKSAPLPPSTPKTSTTPRPLIIDSADIPKPSAETTPNIPLPPPTPVIAGSHHKIDTTVPPQPRTDITPSTPVAEPEAHPVSDSEMGLDTLPLVVRLDSPALVEPTPTIRTETTTADEAVLQARFEAAKAELDSTGTKMIQDLERYIGVSAKHRKTSPLIGRNKLEEVDTDLNTALEEFLTATLEYHTARFDAKQYTPAEQQRLEAVIQPKIASIVKETLEARLHNLAQVKVREIIEQKVENSVREHIQVKPNTTGAEIDILRGDLRQKYGVGPLSHEETEQINTYIESVRQQGLNNAEKAEINAYRSKLLAEGLSDAETDRLIRGYLTHKATEISQKIAEGIYEGESKGKQDKTRLAFRTAFAKDVAKIEDGKLKKAGRLAKKWGVVALASITAHAAGRVLGESGIDRAVRVGASVAGARSVVNYANRGMARQKIGTRAVFHPVGSLKPSDAIRRNVDGTVLSGTVDYDHAQTLAEERKYRAMVAANTRISEQIGDLELTREKDKTGKEKKRVVRTDFIKEAYTGQTREIKSGNKRRARLATAIGLAVGTVGEAGIHQAKPVTVPDGPPPVTDPTIVTLP